MNIREVEALLKRIQDFLRYDCANPGFTRDDSDAHEIANELIGAISWCRRQQRATAKRKLEFKLKAAEAREALR